jgi:hypothetical protein
VPAACRGPAIGLAQPRRQLPVDLGEQVLGDEHVEENDDPGVDHEEHERGDEGEAGRRGATPTFEGAVAGR